MNSLSFFWQKNIFIYHTINSIFIVLLYIVYYIMSVPFSNSKTRREIGGWFAALVWIYVVAAFFVPIVPLKSNPLISSFADDHIYTATWTHVYAHGEAIPGATPFNVKHVNFFVLSTPKEVYYHGEALPGADPQTTVVVSGVYGLRSFGATIEIPLYLYDEDNVYVNSSTVLPREKGVSALSLYDDYQQEFWSTTETWDIKS